MPRLAAPDPAVVPPSSRFLSAALCAALMGACSVDGPAPAASDQPPATGSDPGDPAEAQRAFFENMRAMCGQTFGGRTVFAEEGDTTFEPARLYFVVEECDGDELRMPFVVGGDASRTWVLTLDDDGLTFHHEHLRDDGTEYETSGFGGRASDDGTALFQHFPDFWATEATPAAERRVWRLRIDPEHDLFVYYLDRGGRLAYRLVFHLGPPSPAL